MSKDKDNDKVTNIVVAGLGGQGVLTATDILADVAVSAGLDVKKSELHGMSQRGGSVSSDVRFGAKVFSPMVPEGEADYLVVISADQVSVNAAALRKDGDGVGVGGLIELVIVFETHLRNKRRITVALRGALSGHLPFTDNQSIASIKRNFPEAIHDVTLEACRLGNQ